MEKKYESDLSRKERWDKQMETIRGLKGMERLDYLWSYYKYVLVLLAAAILVLSVVFTMIRNGMNETMLSIVIVDAARDDTAAAEELEEEILQILGAEGKYDQVETVLSATSVDEEYSIAKLRISLSQAGGSDVVICGQDVYEEYSEQGAFLDMEEVLGDDYEQYASYLDGDCLELDQCGETFLDSYVSDSPAYLCVLASSERQEAAAELIKELLN